MSWVPSPNARSACIPHQVMQTEAEVTWKHSRAKRMVFCRMWTGAGMEAEAWVPPEQPSAVHDPPLCNATQLPAGATHLRDVHWQVAAARHQPAQHRLCSVGRQPAQQLMRVCCRHRGRRRRWLRAACSGWCWRVCCRLLPTPRRCWSRGWVCGGGSTAGLSLDRAAPPAARLRGSGSATQAVKIAKEHKEQAAEGCQWMDGDGRSASCTRTARADRGPPCTSSPTTQQFARCRGPAGHLGARRQSAGPQPLAAYRPPAPGPSNGVDHAGTAAGAMRPPLRAAACLRRCRRHSSVALPSGYMEPQQLAWRLRRQAQR